jgi:class 3 adenylate cyclase/tetratricopeptide (TPR) repeat protein
MRCERCGSESPEGFRFCGNCGAPLPRPGAVRPEAERKLVTALFCDLVGFTQRAERLDPEDVRHMLNVYYASARGELERFGGTVAKFIGDAVFALFGAPRAHEDDPERAVRAALAALDAVADLNAARPELDLHVRIGVTTGEALVATDVPAGEAQDMAWGDVLNTASRLQSAAPTDGVLVDDATYRATRDVIEYATAEPVLAKGKAEPVVVWRPLAPVSRRGLDLALGEVPPLIDRDGEMHALRAALDDVRARREPQLITLVGDAGIGKSHLVLELFRHVDALHDLIHWRHGRSPPHPAGVSYWALGEVVKAHAGMLESDGAAAAASKLSRAVRDVVDDPADAERIEGHLRSLVGLGGEPEARIDERGAAFAAWRHFLEALARRRPLVLVLEDLHWADDGLLDFVEHLVEWTRDVPLLVVCTSRPEIFERRTEWGERDRATTLLVAALTTEHTRELVSSLAGDVALPREMADEIVARSAGNPLYSVEFARMLDSLEPDASLEALPIPGSLRAMIASRLDSLPPEEKGLLQAGSVVGRAVWPGALAAITGRPRRWVVRRLRRLEDGEFLTRRRRSSVENETEYRFAHVLVRDVAYGAIPRRRRGEIHRRTAEWLESLSPDRAADRAEMLAHHYLQAYEMATAAGGRTAALAERARRALRDAGDRALALHAFPAAARYFRAARELWPDDDPDLPWLLLRLGKSLYYAETAGAEELTCARDALLAAGDRGAAAEAEAVLAYLAHHEGRRDLFSGHLERAVALVDDLGPTRAKAEVLVDLANDLSMTRDHERTLAVAGEAREIAQALGLQELTANALAIIGISRGLSGDLGGRVDLERSIAITEEIGSHLSAQSCGMLADLECHVGNLGACFELQTRARDHAERFGHAGFVRWLAAERVGEGYWTGAWDEALGRADAFIDEAESGVPNFMEAYCRTMRGRIRLARGDAAGALLDAARAVEFARAAEDVQMLYPALAFGARVEVAAGSREAGEVLTDDLLAIWRSKLELYPASSWTVDLVIALDALDRGADLVETAAAVNNRTRWLDAVRGFAAGDFETAAMRFAAIGSLPDEAVSRLKAGEALVAAGRAHEAQAELGRALDFFRRVRASRHIAEAKSLSDAALSRKTGTRRLA